MKHDEQKSDPTTDDLDYSLVRVTRAKASNYLLDKYGILRSPATLAKLASIGGGPTFQKVGRFPMYLIADLDAWASALIGRGCARRRSPPRRWRLRSRAHVATCQPARPVATSRSRACPGARSRRAAGLRSPEAVAGAHELCRRGNGVESGAASGREADCTKAGLARSR